MPPGLTGLRVIAFESRRSAEMAELIRNFGGDPIQAAAMREVPLAGQQDALAFGEALLAGDVNILILLTGVGTRMLIRALSTRGQGPRSAPRSDGWPSHAGKELRGTDAAVRSASSPSQSLDVDDPHRRTATRDHTASTSPKGQAPWRNP